jgi:hypothetical protein
MFKCTVPPYISLTQQIHCNALQSICYVFIREVGSANKSVRHLHNLGCSLLTVITTAHINCTATPLHLHAIPATPLHLHAVPATPLHLHAVPTTPLHLHAVPATPLHLHAVLSTPLHLHDVPPTPLHLHAVPATPLHLHAVPTTPLHLHAVPATPCTALRHTDSTSFCRPILCPCELQWRTGFG